MTIQSTDVAKASIQLAISSREEEQELKARFAQRGIQSAAVDFGGDYLNSRPKIIERAIVAARREGIVPETHWGEGAVAGATKEALLQVSPRAEGFSVGGKIAIARSGEHLSVTVFLGVGMVHLNDVVIGIGHRSLYAERVK